MQIKLVKLLRYYSPLVVAAATENNDDSENDDPGAVIVEKMAKAVVVHRYVPPKNDSDVASLIYRICISRILRDDYLIKPSVPILLFLTKNAHPTDYTI